MKFLQNSWSVFQTTNSQIKLKNSLIKIWTFILILCRRSTRFCRPENIVGGPQWPEGWLWLFDWLIGRKQANSQKEGHILKIRLIYKIGYRCTYAYIANRAHLKIDTCPWEKIHKTTLTFTEHSKEVFSPKFYYKIGWSGTWRTKRQVHTAGRSTADQLFTMI